MPDDATGNVTAMKDYKYNSGIKTLYRFTEKRYDDFRKAISEAERNTGEIYDNAKGPCYLNARHYAGILI